MMAPVQVEEPTTRALSARKCSPEVGAIIKCPDNGDDAHSGHSDSSNFAVLAVRAQFWATSCRALFTLSTIQPWERNCYYPYFADKEKNTTERLKVWAVILYCLPREPVLNCCSVLPQAGKAKNEPPSGSRAQRCPSQPGLNNEVNWGLPQVMTELLLLCLW